MKWKGWRPYGCKFKCQHGSCGTIVWSFGDREATGECPQCPECGDTTKRDRTGKEPKSKHKWWHAKESDKYHICGKCGEWTWHSLAHKGCHGCGEEIQLQADHAQGGDDEEAAKADGQGGGVGTGTGGTAKDTAAVKKLIDQLVLALGPQSGSVLYKLLPSEPPPEKSPPGEGAVWNELSRARAAEKKTAIAEGKARKKA